ncbi:transposase [Mucilaginibacter celer]|uniref:Transposase n=1 Tax=Mucilaginibacter celer TaxID=2305508 RepID=A0A494W3F0_9SPHI|nr:transposase [Mucilaginibacter celer]
MNNWIPLLETDEFKRIVLDSLIFLVKQKKLEVYGFVIMPNHIHVIWSGSKMNGKEKPFASFTKFTGHRFLSELRKTDEGLLARFKTDLLNRNYLFSQTNALAKKIHDRKMLEQKLDYIHLNPLQPHWNLVSDPNDYYFSSCSFYEQEDKKFDWLTHYMDAI